MSDVFALGIGLATTNSRGEPLDCLFPQPHLTPTDATLEAAQQLPVGSGTIAPDELAKLDPQGLLAPKSLLESDTPLTRVNLQNDTAIESNPEAYLKLHLLSHRLTLPNTLNLDGIFAHLPNLAWTSSGPMELAEANDALVRAKQTGQHLEIMSVDKFPKMVNYVLPTGVRIADASRIRLGAYLGDGTTVMHEGFVNFNAGSMGPKHG